jgi:hypothetical protein
MSDIIMGGYVSKKSLVDYTDAELEELVKAAIINDPFRSSPHANLSNDESYVDTVAYMATIGVRPITASEYRRELLQVQRSKVGHKISLWQPLSEPVTKVDRMELSEDVEAPTERYMFSTCTATEDFAVSKAPKATILNEDKVFVDTPNKRLCIEVVLKDENDWKGVYVVQQTTEMDGSTVTAISNESTEEWAARK